MNIHASHSPPGAAGSNDSANKAWLRALALIKPIAGDPTCLLSHRIDALAATSGDASALLSVRETFTFRALSQRSARYARWALAQGINKGDAVALLMPNRPEYMAIWLGITQVGGIVALLNTNLVGSSLAHCIDAVTPKHIIVDADLSAGFESSRPHLKTNSLLWLHGSGTGADIDAAVTDLASDPLTATERRATVITNCALYIYTSGTTGLPKAAKVSHQRLLMWSAWFAGMMDTRPDDRLYNCLPMYHSVGGVVATGAVLLNGGSVAIREKFSASRFWDDITRFDCTLFQYIGELCRYLVHSPPHACEGAHHLRLCCGNGLRADVWEQFQQRFRIPRILEFYAATEGNVTMFNAEGKPGAIGRVPSFLAHRTAIALVKFNAARGGEPERDEHGLCIRCGVNEPGEALGRIVDGAAGPGGRFEGYTDTAASNAKILRDVFQRGDAWYRTGDLMRKDEGGFFYFVDRIGDTFRWHGENVSTDEVAAALTSFPGIIDATVYGVSLPGTEGRAGMGAIVATRRLDLKALRAHLREQLPEYAQPLLLRFCKEIETTATFKHRKNELADDGFNPAALADLIYFDDSVRQTFVRLYQTTYERIARGELRL